MNDAGEQIDSQQLYKLQKLKKTDAKYRSAPAILLVGLSKSENIGAVYRLADAAGCETIYIFNDDSNKIDHKIITRVSRSTSNSIKTISLSLQELQQKRNDLPPLIAVEITTQSTSILETQLPEQCVLVLGNEKRGVTDEVLCLCNSAVHVPMFGINGSMNVSHSLAVVIYEWRRQNK